MVRVLSSKGLTFLVFMGHVLSVRGIGLAFVKVKAVVDEREPKNVADVRSFLPSWSILPHVLFLIWQQYPHLSASLQRMEKRLCVGQSSSNHLTS